MIKASPGLIERYFDHLPIEDRSKIVTLGEGNTPLIEIDDPLFPQGLQVFLKFEGTNPTGSFKDRGMTMAVTRAHEQDSRAVLCASTGNTSAAAAAYAAKAGMQCFVVIPEGKIAMGKLAQAMIHGAHVVQIQGNFDDGMNLVKSLAQELPITLVNSVNPYRLEGQKTVAFEVVDTLGQAPDYHYLPVGNAGNISAHWMGYKEYQALGRIEKMPVMVGAQAKGANPFIQGGPIEAPETIATAIRIGNPQSYDKAVNAQTESKGWFLEVSDEAILEAQSLLACKGVFCEPASGASFAGLIQDLKKGKGPKEGSVVCTLTGHGLKDPQIAIEQAKHPLVTVGATFDEIKAYLEQKLL